MRSITFCLYIINKLNTALTITLEYPSMEMHISDDQLDRYNLKATSLSSCRIFREAGLRNVNDFL